MEILITILVIAIIVLAITCYSMFEMNKKAFERVLDLTVNYHSVVGERNAFENESKILETELNILKEFEQKERTEKDFVVSNNKRIKMKETFKGKKLLLGDYNIDMLRHSRKIFLSLGFDVDIVESGDDLIQKIMCGYNYDVIVTNNIYKNSCDGPDVLRELRKIYDFTTPIVVLTVSTGQKDKFINEMGFDGYLEKMLTQKQAEMVMSELLLDKKGN